MRLALIAGLAILLVPLDAQARCARFPERDSTAFNQASGRITLPWRTDFPTSLPAQTHAWQGIDMKADWRAYIAAVLSEIKAADVKIANNTITMKADAAWWIAPWMDFGSSGREFLLGLTKERGPDPRDLSPTSTKDHQVWAVGWYNAEGAFALGQVFADPCNPKIPVMSGGQPWTFPNHTASFKLLFTDAPDTEVGYLAGAPVIEAMIDPVQPPPTPSPPRVKKQLRLLQVDIAVRDPQAEKTEWIMGTFVWKGPRTGDGFFDNLVPVGLMWGNDPERENSVWANFAQLEESQLNPDLAGVIWQGTGGTWPERPYPGFQGRPNGPADNLRSSCLSCHGFAQWRRHPDLGILPKSYPVDPPRTSKQITKLREDYFRNVKGGQLAEPNPPSISLDYSLQLEAAFTRMCQACNANKMTGATPDVCRVPGRNQIDRPNCERTVIESFRAFFTSDGPSSAPEAPPRQ